MKPGRCCALILTTLTVVNGIQPAHPLVRQESKILAKTVSTHGSFEKATQPARHKSLFQRGMRISQMTQDDRPALVGFEDNVCTAELGGYYLPAKASLKDNECLVVSHRDELIRTSMENSGTKLSMTFECAADWKTMKTILHFGANCSMGDDDTMKLTVQDADFIKLQEGECISATNAESRQVEYIKIMNFQNVQEWPDCMKDMRWVSMVAMGGGVGLIILSCMGYYLLKQYRKHHLSKKNAKMAAAYGMSPEQYEAMMNNKGAGKGEGKGPPPGWQGGEGKGKGGGGDFGGKGKAKGKGKGKKGLKKGEAYYEGEEEQEPEEGPLDMMVKIISCSDLRKADITGSSDPFVECEVLGKDMKFKTKVVKADLNPKFDHEDRFKGFEPDDKLQFTVYDDDMGGTKKDLLGKCTLKYKDIFPEGCSKELKLEETGDDKVKSKLKVDVSILQIMPKVDDKEKP